MPVMDGLEAARKIREYERAARVSLPTALIALTADTTPENFAACRAAGMDDILTKPLDFAVLIAALRQAFAQMTNAR
jgi:CheY-like chemotaxis protein